MLRSDYSWADRALTFWATLVLAIMAVMSLLLRYVTNPMTCFMPAEFTFNHMGFASSACFYNKELAYLGDGQNPENAGSRSTYHQWVPFALGIGALFCLLPHVIWRMLSGPLLLDTHALLSSVAENQRQSPDRRQVLIRDTAILVQSTLKRSNCLLTVGALFRKLLSCVVCLVQIVWVAVVFTPQLGAESSGEDRNTSTDVIPLPTGTFLCEFQVVQLQKIQRFTVQCMSPLAEVYSKGFTFLFYFFLLLFLLCGLDFLLWAGRLLLPGLNDMQAKSYLGVTAASSSEDGSQESPAQLYPRFAQWLAWDGRLLVALTADYCGPLAAADLTGQLFAVFKAAPRPQAPATTAATTPAVTTEGGATAGAEMESIPLDDVATKVDEKGADQGSSAVKV